MNEAEKELEILAAYVHGKLAAWHEIGAYYNDLLAHAPNRTYKQKIISLAMAAMHKAYCILSRTAYKIHFKDLWEEP